MALDHAALFPPCHSFPTPKPEVTFCKETCCDLSVALLQSIHGFVFLPRDCHCRAPRLHPLCPLSPAVLRPHATALPSWATLVPLGSSLPECLFPLTTPAHLTPGSCVIESDSVLALQGLPPSSVAMQLCICLGDHLIHAWLLHKGSELFLFPTCCIPHTSQGAGHGESICRPGEAGAESFYCQTLEATQSTGRKTQQT